VFEGVGSVGKMVFEGVGSVGKMVFEGVGSAGEKVFEVFVEGSRSVSMLLSMLV
jgi:hypothetical protein